MESAPVKNLIRVKAGCGKHFVKGVGYKAGSTFEDVTGALHLKFPDKLELVVRAEEKSARQSMHPCGEDRTEEFSAACEALQEVCKGEVRVYLKGRRYRILVDGDIQDTDPSNIVNKKQLMKAFSALKKEMQSNLTDDEPEDDAEGDEEAEDSDE